MKICIIGSSGKVGSFFSQLFTDSLNVTLANESQLDTYIAKATHILICVPQEKTAHIVAKLNPLVNENHVVIDTSSSMNAPLESLHCITARLHPLFSPNADTKKKAVLVSDFDKELESFTSALTARNITIIRCSKQKHQQTMAYVQALSHFIGICFAATLSHAEDTESLTVQSTPYFQLLMDSISRMFAQEASMYAQIQFENPYFADILQTFTQEFKNVQTAFEAKNITKYQEIFDRVKRKLPQLAYHYKESNSLLAALHTKIAVLGPKGSFSDEAASLLEASKVYVQSFTQATDAILDGTVEFALLPIENSVGGSVAEVSDLLLEKKLKILQEFTLPIHQCLAGYMNENVDCIMSHPQALMQCSRFLTKYSKANIIQTSSTASAIQTISQEKKLGTLAIASKYCANIYSVPIIAENIENEANNTTRFIVVGKKNEGYANKATIVIVPQTDKPGLLFEILKIFYDHNLNLSRIESRPSKKALGVYVFHIDVLINANRQGYTQAKRQLSEQYEIIDLGEYYAHQ